MKRIFFFLLVILFVSLSACTSIPSQPVIDYVPLAPTITTNAQEQVVELTTPTPPLTVTEVIPQPTTTGAATQPPAQMPPLKTGGWQRMGEGLPFTFELPEGWITPDAFIKGAHYWVPAGIPLVNGHPALVVDEAEMVSEQEPQTWPQNSAVQSRTTIEANGVSYTMVQVKVFNGEGGAVNAYETHVVIPMRDINKVYGIYIISPTEESRAALEGILVHAVESLSFK